MLKAQTIFMIFLTLVGTLGAFAFSPFWGVQVYYFYAVLRPDFIWWWVPLPDFAWSFYVAVATICAALAHKLKLMAYTTDEKDKKPASPLCAPHYWVLAFGGWVCLSYFSARDQDWAYIWLVEYLKILIMFVVSALLIKTVGNLWALLVTTGIALGYIGYDVNDLYLTYRTVTIYEWGYGGLDNNGAGLMMAMGVPICLFIWEGTQRWWRWLFAAFVPILVHAVLMSFSRGAMVALLLACPLFFLRSRQRKFLVPAGVAFILLLLPVMAGKEVRQRFFSIQQYEEDGSAQSRLKSWSAAWEMAKDNPILGVGLRNADRRSKEYGADIEGRTIHSQYLQILADTGFPGLALYLGVLGSVWLGLRRARIRFQNLEGVEARKGYAVTCAVEGGMAVFCVGALFLSLEVFELPYLLLLLGAELTVMVNRLEQRRQVQAMPSAPLPGRDLAGITS